jgi:hypothetical protein
MIEPHLWRRHREQCPQIPRNSRDSFACNYQMRQTWRQASLHSCPWRQHLSHRLALQIQQALTRIIVLSPGKDDSMATADRNHHRQHPLPGQPEYSRGPQHSLRPPKLRRQCLQIPASLSSGFPNIRNTNPALPLPHTAVNS